MLKSVIREFGLSDSAAAVRLGLAASTVSRWKRNDAEVRATLEQAREECRALQLQRVMQSAAAEHGRGWRAAAWLLERLFPEDYAANAGVREGFRQMAERRAEREEAEAQAAETKERLRARFQPVEEEAVADPKVAHFPAAQREFTQESDLQNCRNSSPAMPIPPFGIETPRRQGAKESDQTCLVSTP